MNVSSFRIIHLRVQGMTTYLTMRNISNGGSKVNVPSGLTCLHVLCSVLRDNFSFMGFFSLDVKIMSPFTNIDNRNKVTLYCEETFKHLSSTEHKWSLSVTTLSSILMSLWDKCKVTGWFTNLNCFTFIICMSASAHHREFNFSIPKGWKQSIIVDLSLFFLTC